MMEVVTSKKFFGMLDNFNLFSTNVPFWFSGVTEVEHWIKMG